MRIFLSFASEHNEIAESILLALRDRGYTVFFSRDDLPPGDTFDIRIQRAVQATDLMIFLVSPESVTKGRYTLTELSFVRQRWPNPRGHVLPVLIAPTPLSAIPVYLKSITILEPAGNIAAETSAAVDGLVGKSNKGAIVRFALLGVLSAVCSYLAVRFGETEQFPFLWLAGAPLLPGLFFGLLTAACARHFGVRDRFLLVIICLITIGAWIASVNSAISVNEQLSGYTKRPPVAEASDSSDATKSDSDDRRAERLQQLAEQSLPFRLGIAGIVAGFVGGLITVFGVSIGSPGFRRLDSWIMPLVIATVLGSTLEVMRIEKSIGSLWMLILFMAWQPAVVAAIARELARGRHQPEDIGNHGTPVR